MAQQLSLARKSKRDISDRFDRWCRETGQDFPSPKFGCFGDVAVKTGDVKIVFLNPDEFRVVERALLKIKKMRGMSEEERLMV
jgi:hypothetical protein